ncbi:uncharacterized protein [Amphiura filiformis]|uniref:uncharacterized protein n=1 Tax=Amphiura filiformis TaxID=82378 RepID=UPI003B22659F
MGCSATKTIQSESGSEKSNEEEKVSQSKDGKSNKSHSNSTPKRKLDKTSANNNHNSNSKPTDGSNKMDESRSPSGRKPHRPNLSPCSPLYNSNKLTSQSQTDFFRILDEKIEQGKDYYSEDSREDGIT